LFLVETDVLSLLVENVACRRLCRAAVLHRTAAAAATAAYLVCGSCFAGIADRSDRRLLAGSYDLKFAAGK
jgi:hypothetical protein